MNKENSHSRCITTFK